jgi:anaerobic ribonucleoside-triphosphate reductase activating protein
MGGEPLCETNAFLTRLIIQEVRKHAPDAKIYIWSGYTYEELMRSSDPHIIDSLRLADVLIDGPYIEAERDITLPMRGSRNQRIIDLSEKN